MELNQSSAWLEHHFNTIDMDISLDDQLMAPIRNFPFIWNIFECRVGEDVMASLCHYSPSDECVRMTFSFFHNRYVENGMINDCFDDLWPSARKSHRKEVIRYLCSKAPSLQEQNIACGMICQRLRHNFIHGRKRPRELPEQSELFNVADNYLQELIEHMP